MNVAPVSTLLYAASTYGSLVVGWLHTTANFAASSGFCTRRHTLEWIVLASATVLDATTTLPSLSEPVAAQTPVSSWPGAVATPSVTLAIVGSGAAGRQLWLRHTSPPLHSLLVRHSTHCVSPGAVAAHTGAATLHPAFVTTSHRVHAPATHAGAERPQSAAVAHPLTHAPWWHV